MANINDDDDDEETTILEGPTMLRASVRFYCGRGGEGNE